MLGKLYNVQFKYTQTLKYLYICIYYLNIINMEEMALNPPFPIWYNEFSHVVRRYVSQITKT